MGITLCSRAKRGTVFHCGKSRMSKITYFPGLNNSTMPSTAHLNITSLSREGWLKGTLYILLTTHKFPINPNTYLQLLHTCFAKNALLEGKQIYSFITDRGFTFATRPFFQNKLINMYIKCGSLVDARKAFDKMTERDGFSWNVMIAAYRRHGFPDEALTLFYHMQRTGLQPDQFTFASVLPACAKIGALELGTDIHQSIIESGFFSDIIVTNALIDMYSKCGSIHKAWQLFDKMPQRNVVSWNATIAGYVQNGVLDKALRLFKEMPGRDVISWNVMIAGYAQNGLVEKAWGTFKQMKLAGVKPNPTTITSILSACAKMGALEKGMEIHQSIIESGFSPDDIVVSALVSMYAKCGTIPKAQELFDKIPRRNVVSWTAMIAGYAQNGLVEKALETLKQMQLVGVKPNSATFAGILPACAKMGALEWGVEIHQSIIENGFLSDDVVVSALVDMYAKCGRLQKARELFDKMSQRDAVSWSAMIAGYAMHGFHTDSLKLFELMKHFGTYPDHVCIVCVLFACSHAGLVDEGSKYFNTMSDSYCIMPTMDHYVCMVDLLSRAGYLEGALNFIIKMPAKPAVAVWMCLLGACRSCKNTVLGVFTATLLFELDPKYTAPYVLLSNIYAEVGMWGDVQKVRKLMTDTGIKKVPGCSWIEVHKMVHTFYVGDRSHPQTQEIYAELEKLSWEMKTTGYFPDSNHVLNDVEEEEKQLFLCHHSEKLAIVFGLLNTSPGTTIRVIKNLRVCGDCHTATKFISNIVAREIVVRDWNRFHHFKHGQCSCGDYW